MLMYVFCGFAALLFAAADTVVVLRIENEDKMRKLYIVGCILSIGVSTGLVLFRNMVMIYALLLLLVICILNLICVYDIQSKYIPNILLWVLIAIGFVTSFFVPETFFLKNLIAAWAIAGICFFVGRKIKGGIGMGDILCMSGLLMCMSFEGMMNFMFSSLFIAMVYGIICMIAKKKTLKTELAFAPFMLIGFMCMILFS